MKYLVYIIVLLLFLFVQNIVISTTQPEIETTIALEQFANPSVVTDTTFRAYKSIYWSNLFFVPYILIVGYSIRKDLKKLKENK